MRRTLAIFALATSSSLASFTYASENAILVLDASGSMWGQLNGKTKIEIACAAVADLTTAWPVLLRRKTGLDLRLKAVNPAHTWIM